MSAYAGDTLTISAVGDIMMGTTYPEVLLPPGDGDGMFDEVKEHLSADIVFANLEGPLIDGGKPCPRSARGALQTATNSAPPRAMQGT